MSYPESKTTGSFEIVRQGQLPENYDKQLESEALDMIRAVAHADPDIDLALRGLNDEQLKALKDADSVEAFKEALSAFSDRSIYVIAGALEVLDTSIGVMSGRSGSNTPEIIFDDNKEVVSQFRRVKATAKEILQQLRSDILAPEGQNQPVHTY